MKHTLLITFLILNLFPLWGLGGFLHAQTNTPSPPEAGGLDSLLLLAVQANKLPEVQKLVAQGANVNAKYKTKRYYDNGNTPLHEVRNLDIAQLLIDKGADVNAKNESEVTPLHEALSNSRVEIAQLLIEKGADVKANAGYSGTPLHKAGDIEMVRLLIDKGADVNANANKYYGTPLHEQSNIEIVKLLIEKGADVNAKSGYRKNTPLHEMRDAAIAQLLLENGAETEVKNRAGLTPLHEASVSAHLLVVQVLLEKGANVNARSDRGQSPLHLVQDIRITNLLLEKGADVQLKDAQGNTPLYLALEHKSAIITQTLIAKGADIHAKNNQGNTPLHFALKYGVFEIAQLLIEKGADIQAVDKFGNTALHFAVLGNDLQQVQYFLKKGLNPQQANQEDKTPIHLSKENKQEAVYATLLGDISYQTYLSTAPLWQAIKQMDRTKAKMALQAKADTSYRNFEGKNTRQILQDFQFASWEDFLEDKLFYTAQTFVQIGHAGDVEQIILLPDNKSFLSKSSGEIKRWDIATSKEIQRFTGHVGDITKIVLLPDGKTFLSASGDKTIKHWDIATGKVINTFIGDSGEMYDITLILLPDSKSFLSQASADNTDNAVKYWDLTTGKEILSFATKGQLMNVLPDGKSFYCFNHSLETTEHWDLITGKKIHTFETYVFKGISYDQELLPDGKTFFGSASDSTFKQWDFETGKEVHTFEGFFNTPLPDGKSFLYRSKDKKSIIQWDFKAGKEVRSIKVEGYVKTILPDGKTFLTISDNRTIKYWELASGKEIHAFVGHTDYIDEILLLPDAKTFLTRSRDKTIKYWDLVMGKEIHTFQGHTDEIDHLILLPDAKTFLSYCEGSREDKTIKYWDLISGKEIHSFKSHTDEVNQVILLPNSKSFLSASDDNTIKHWDLVSGKEISTFYGNTASIENIIFSQDNTSFMSTGGDNVIKQWDFTLGKITQNFQGQSSPILLSDNKTFLTTDNNTVKHWDLATGKEIRTFANSYSITLLPDNKSFLTTSLDNTVKHWDLASGKEIRTFAGHTASITNVLLLPDNKSFLTASGWYGGDNTVKHWDLASGKEIHTFFTGHTHIILLPDNKTFLSASRYDDNKIVKHWDITTGKEIQTFHEASFPILLPDNKTFLTSDYNTIRYWDLASGKEINHFQIYDDYHYALDSYNIQLLPDGETALFFPDGTISTDAYTFKHYNFITGEEIKSYKFSDHPGVHLLSDSVTFLATRSNGTINHMHLASGRELGSFKGRYGEAESIHFLTDSTRFITVNSQNSLTLWDFKTYKEIATLIPVAGDNQDYVVLSPDGRFDGTPAGMDKLVHFVVGNEIIELSQLKERFYTPDLWKTLLTAPEKLGTVENLKEIRLYPEMEIKGKGNTLTLTLKPRSGGIGKVNVYINGREVNESKTALPDFNPQRKNQIQLNLKNYQSYFSEGKNTISVKAYHAEGWLASRFQHITYQKGSLQSRDTTSKAKPEGLQEDEAVDFDANITESKAVGDFYALCIGTSDYVGEGIKDLTFPTSDAQSMAEALKIGAKKFFVDEDEPNKNKIFIRTLTTDDKNPLNQPSKDNIRRVFGEIASKAKAEDMFVVFFAGHGTTFKKEDERFELFYYLTKDAGSRSVTQDALRKSHTISSDELIAWLKEIKAGKQVMILDACHSGQAVDNIFAQRDIPPSQKRALELMKDRTGLYIISGSAADAVSYESSEYGQGFLTYSLLLGMTGAALDKENSHLNVGTWFKYASNEVNRMAAEYNSTQQPQVAEPKNNFWIGKFEEKDRNLIPLKEAKPMFGEPRFMNGDKLRDDLGLEKLVKSELVEGLYNARSANYIFTDSDSKKIHQINGLYTIDAQGNIKITLKIYKGDDLKAEIKDLEGNVKEIKDLAEMIVSEAKKRVVK